MRTRFATYTVRRCDSMSSVHRGRRRCCGYFPARCASTAVKSPKAQAEPTTDPSESRHCKQFQVVIQGQDNSRRVYLGIAPQASTGGRLDGEEAIVLIAEDA